ncbi:hydantoinase B/oxoprolinase family protein [Paraburkholderia sp. Ac-20336]|uniref:hydantoinase B/oxoprolinase family protein n=1 Tax=unclassified Paraburkholderia TaxID=2615204 RepID=UPI00197DD5FA|nr:MULTISPECIES: hydantoinase B/oxoprolinase family protein [unclassified Paraburkholderia]MBN3801471.1 hydantoinase B/oxoprolinase family protein [Paraburkholderia sp. Ac-20336]MBN3846022.1 hydantoinase B/oxoprolinase family protein [Paraburkholderia sp. Ac-20342]
MKTIDSVTLSVIQSGLQQVCNEMDLAFCRAAFSPVISESQDRSNGIYDRETGRLIAQGDYGLPIFVGTMQFSTQEVIRRAKEIREGDIFVINDPYMGGTHLMDVRFTMPFFYRGELFAWLANTGHWPDIGGMVPGGFSAHATEIEQEGLRLPPVKLFKEGQLDEELLSIIMSNIRIAEQRIGDIKAQAAALTIGAERLTQMLDRYGKDTIEAAIAALNDRSEAQMRDCIRQIPDGEYRGRSYLDSDGVVDEPLVIDLTVTKRGDSLTFDLSQSSPPCQGPMNSVLATTKASVYLAMKHIFPDVPINAGTFAPIEVLDPVGTFLDAQYPRPVSGCAAEVSQRIAEAVFHALVDALPDLLFAAPAGTTANLAIGGHDPERNRSYVMYAISGGGYGGYSGGDGLTNGCSTIGISKSQPVEILEQNYPILFEQYAIHEGSGGAGTYRGGMGIHFRLRLLRGTAKASMVMDHGRFGPPGARGGKDGGKTRIVIYRDGEPYEPPHVSKDQGIVLKAGDIVEVFTPGGGGFGNPGERARDALEADIELGYYTRELAEALFS